MTANRKYALLSIVTAIAVAGVSFGALSSAQTVMPLTCGSNLSSVAINQPAVLIAMGGTGTYAWSGPDLSPATSAGSQFSVSYSTAGTYPVTITSGNQTATCNVTVAGTVSTDPLTCFPATQDVTLGQTATVSASGGNGTYTWSSNNAASIVGNPSGSGVTVDYGATGMQTMVLTSGGLVTTCAVEVNPATTVAPTTPGLPDTGGGYGQ